MYSYRFNSSRHAAKRMNTSISNILFVEWITISIHFHWKPRWFSVAISVHAFSSCFSKQCCAEPSAEHMRSLLIRYSLLHYLVEMSAKPGYSASYQNYICPLSWYAYPRYLCVLVWYCQKNGMAAQSHRHYQRISVLCRIVTGVTARFCQWM